VFNTLTRALYLQLAKAICSAAEVSHDVHKTCSITARGYAARARSYAFHYILYGVYCRGVLFTDAILAKWLSAYVVLSQYSAVLGSNVASGCWRLDLQKVRHRSL